MTTKEDLPQEPDGTHQPTAAQSIEQHYRLLEEENQTLRESETRLRQQYAESQRRERILVKRLAAKEQEMQDYASQVAELKTAQASGPNALRTTLLDPAVNILFQKLKAELQATKAKMEETQNELSAWKFTPDSNNGKRLMAKCRLLHQENEELGKMTSNGRLAKLEGDLALQKSFSEEIKKSQSELDDFLQELDEDVEGMQSTIVFLQQELKAAKETIQSLEREINLLKISSKDPHIVNGTSNNHSEMNVNCSNNSNSSSINEQSERTSISNFNNGLTCNNNYNNNISNEDIKRTNINSKYCNGDINLITNNSDEQKNDSLSNSNNKNNDNQLTNTTTTTENSLVKKRSYDSDSSEYSNDTTSTVTPAPAPPPPAPVVIINNNTSTRKLRSKKPRRTSILSLDLNEDENDMIDPDENDTKSNGKIISK